MGSRKKLKEDKRKESTYLQRQTHQNYRHSRSKRINKINIEKSIEEYNLSPEANNCYPGLSNYLYKLMETQRPSMTNPSFSQTNCDSTKYT